MNSTCAQVGSARAISPRCRLSSRERDHQRDEQNECDDLPEARGIAVVQRGTLDHVRHRTQRTMLEFEAEFDGVGKRTSSPVILIGSELCVFAGLPLVKLIASRTDQDCSITAAVGLAFYDGIPWQRLQLRHLLNWERCFDRHCLPVNGGIFPRRIAFRQARCNICCSQDRSIVEICQPQSKLPCAF